jgi:hypothetical protein
MRTVLIITLQNSHWKERSPCELIVAQKFPYFFGTQRLITSNGDPVVRFTPSGNWGVADASEEFYVSVFRIEVIMEKKI